MTPSYRAKNLSTLAAFQITPSDDFSARLQMPTTIIPNLVYDQQVAPVRGNLLNY